MSINKFFIDTLGANLTNPRWSWGAYDPSTNRVYLRVWADNVETTDFGERVRVGSLEPRRKPKSAGFNERHRHLDMIRQGAEGFGVVCTAVDPDTDGVRAIAHFDSEYLLRLGQFEEEDGQIIARIEARVPVQSVERRRTAQSTLASDLKKLITTRKKGPTTKESLINARVGQGDFRTRVLKMWGNRCAITGATTLDAIRASHIKPWRYSSDTERLDPHNGLPLVASIDALFDVGFISFESNGNMIVSPILNDSERYIFGLREQSLREVLSDATHKYLQYHREYHRAKLFREGC